MITAIEAIETKATTSQVLTGTPSIEIAMIVAIVLQIAHPQAISKLAKKKW